MYFHNRGTYSRTNFNMNDTSNDKLSIDGDADRISVRIGTLKISAKKLFLRGKWGGWRQYRHQSILILYQVAHQR